MLHENKMDNDYMHFSSTWFYPLVHQYYQDEAKIEVLNSWLIGLFQQHKETWSLRTTAASFLSNILCCCWNHTESVVTNSMYSTVHFCWHRTLSIEEEEGRINGNDITFSFSLSSNMVIGRYLDMCCSSCNQLIMYILWGTLLSIWYKDIQKVLI